MDEWDNPNPGAYDFIFLGCWTKGLMIVNQHPEKEWSRLVSSMRIPENARIALFATYKIATGSMFSRMRKALNGTSTRREPEIKSRTGKLTAHDKKSIENIIIEKKAGT